MTVPEPTQPDVSDSPAPKQVTQRGRLDRWLPVMVVTVVVIARVGVIFFQPGWQSFTDSLRLYSLYFPSGWTVQSETNYATFGDPSGSATDPWESVTVSEASHGAGGASVYIVAGPIDNTAFEHHWYCQGGSGSPFTIPFHFYRATGIPFDTLLFNTAGAHFQIDVTIPGVVSPPRGGLNPPPTPAVPPTWIAADFTYVTEILDSFHPSNPLPLYCH